MMYMKGFTLIETLVAIAILTTAMVAPFYALQESIKSADVSRDEITGSNLAQEGVEYVRSIRDGNYLYVRENPSSTQTWLYGLDGTTSNSITSPNCFTPNLCTVDATALATTPVVSYTSTSSVPVLTLSSASYLYNQANNGTPTIFKRTVQLTTITAWEVRVNVTVAWTTDHIPYVTTVSEYLDNWLP